MKKSLLGIIPIIAILLGACTKDKLTGEGPIITENRTLLVLGGLNTVKVNGSTDVHVTQGDEYKLEVKGYGNLVVALSTDVKNNVLVLEFPNHYNVRNDNTEIFLTIPHLPNLYINGSADADVSGNFPDQADLFFHVNGSAKINAGSINVENLDVNINGSGDLNITNVMAQYANISINGSGKVKTTVSDHLKASISGSGEINYYGDAVVETNISGSGKVEKL